MFEPMCLTTSNVPHAQLGAAVRMYREQLRYFGLRAIRNLYDCLIVSLFLVHLRTSSRIHVEVSNSTIGGQVSVVHRWDCETLAQIH